MRSANEIHNWVKKMCMVQLKQIGLTQFPYHQFARIILLMLLIFFFFTECEQAKWINLMMVIVKCILKLHNESDSQSTLERSDYPEVMLILEIKM